MTKPKDKDEVEEIPWTPDKPLADDDDETETQRRAQAEARKAYLISQYAKEPEKKKSDKKKSGLWGS